MTSSGLDGLTHVHSGKVRDLYRTESGALLVVASDRISAYDHVLAPEVPDKGRILTAMSAWWFEQLASVVPNHVISVDDPAIPAQFRGRAMLCQELRMIPIEAVVRGYLAGSALAEYDATSSVCGILLPAGLVAGDRLENELFTPATKAAEGEHDENITFDQLIATQGLERSEALRTQALNVYRTALAMAAERGLLIADTKFEFGQDAEGHLVLADEVLTPDSSRFWLSDEWSPGVAQNGFDKQFVRDWLTSPASGWDRAGDAPPPELPAEVVAATRQRYIDVYERLTGLSFDDWLR